MKRPRGSDGAESCDESDASDPTLLLSLPDEVIARIFAVVERETDGPKYLARLSCVCRSWRDAFATSNAWRVLLEQHRRAPSRPRRGWRDLYFAQLKKELEIRKMRHEHMLIRLLASSGVGETALRGDSVSGLRREFKSLGPDLDVNHRFASMRGRTLLGICAAMGRLSCAKELLNAWRRAPTGELHKTKHLIPQCHLQDTDGFTPLMEAAFRGNETMAMEIMTCADSIPGGYLPGKGRGPDGDALRGTRNMPTGGEHTMNAAEWADFRGNRRLARVIRAWEEGRPREKVEYLNDDRGPWTKTNVTPWTV